MVSGKIHLGSAIERPRDCTASAGDGGLSLGFIGKVAGVDLGRDSCSGTAREEADCSAAAEVSGSTGERRLEGERKLGSGSTASGRSSGGGRDEEICSFAPTTTICS